MPWAYRILPADRLIYGRYWGTLRREDFVAGRRAAVADPQFDPSFSHLMDLRNCALDISGDQISALVRSTRTASSARQAFVVTGKAEYGIARMYQVYRELQTSDAGTQIFTTLQEARDWLGIGDLDLPEISAPGENL
jgi:hypothetical protein